MHPLYSIIPYSISNADTTFFCSSHRHYSKITPFCQKNKTINSMQIHHITLHMPTPRLSVCVLAVVIVYLHIITCLVRWLLKGAFSACQSVKRGTFMLSQPSERCGILFSSHPWHAFDRANWDSGPTRQEREWEFGENGLCCSIFTEGLMRLRATSLDHRFWWQSFLGSYSPTAQHFFKDWLKTVNLIPTQTCVCKYIYSIYRFGCR